MKTRKDQPVRNPARNGFRLQPKAFVFVDRASGTKRFEVNASPDGSLPLEESSSLLAMQCVVRGQTPTDFHVMVSVGDELLHGLVPRASRLIEACMSSALPMHVSQRQQQVLKGVLQNLSNKEIAAKLNLAERTVKFHVSALLQKFNVSGRVGLMQKAGDLLSPGSNSEAKAASEVPALIPHRQPINGGSNLQPSLTRLAATERRSSR